MGVYIKGMEMPDRCGHCRFATSFDCGVDGQFIKTHDARRKDCPLISVSEPHGDLIDREWLVDISLHLMNMAQNDDIADGVKWLWQYVIEALTIVPASEEE